MSKALFNTLRIAALTLGTAIALAGIGLALYEGSFLMNSDRTQGVVLTMENNHPRFMFSSKTSRQYEVTSAKALPGLHQGQSVDVVYMADNPTRAQIETGTPLWLTAMILAGIGVVILYAGMFFDKAYKQGSNRA